METSFQVFSTPSLVFLQKWSTDHRTETPRIPVKSIGEGRPPVHVWERAFPSRSRATRRQKGCLFFLISGFLLAGTNNIGILYNESCQTHSFFFEFP